MSVELIKKLEDRIAEYNTSMENHAYRLAQAQQMVREAQEQILLQRGAKIALEEQLEDLKPDSD